MAAQSLGSTATHYAGNAARRWAENVKEDRQRQTSQRQTDSTPHRRPGFFSEAEAKREQQRKANDYGQGNTEPTSKLDRRRWESLGARLDGLEVNTIPLQEGSKEALEAMLAHNPSFKRIIGLNGQSSFVDHQGAIYTVTPEGRVRKRIEAVESFHLIEDFIVGGIEVAAVKGITFYGGKLLVASPELAALSANVLAGAKASGSEAFAKLLSGLGVLSTRGQRDIIKEATYDPLLEVLKSAKAIGNRLEATLNDGTKVIFRRDIGENAHPIGSQYRDPVDHYNIEVYIVAIPCVQVDL